jgi:alkylation response protein AidB-like acyl-CoA dehydrogenase
VDPSRTAEGVAMTWFDDQHEAFRTVVRDFARRELAPHVDRWEAAGELRDKDSGLLHAAHRANFFPAENTRHGRSQEHGGCGSMAQRNAPPKIMKIYIYSATN